jgi:hypothetical protein
VIQLPFKSFIKFIFYANTSILICACSLYKSSGRKDFESNAKQNLTLQEFKPIQCDDISAVSYWYETRITSPHSQWIESLPNLEVWQDNLGDDQVQIRTYEKHNDQTQQLPSMTRCQSTFSTLAEWKQFRSFYLKSLEGDQP